MTHPLEARLRSALQPTYYVVRKLGEGAVGTVFLALEPATRRAVAVKVLATELAQDWETRMRFEREAQAVSVLDHPSIVQIHAVGEVPDGSPYMIMQYVAGASVAARFAKSGPLSVAETRRIVADVARGLAAAHEKGIIHRDIKPANILYDDELGRALISDFGVAAIRKPLGATKDLKLTRTGASVGTLEYMSPEAMLAEPVSDRTDVYALGMMAYELLAGRPAFAARTQHALIMAHLTEVPPMLATLRPDMDPALDQLIASCLNKDAGQRPSATAISQFLIS